ncbi:MAG: hypothetical protein KUG77_30030 [Nannocystaceae bacterium]|nr:hypothetical protein [Nannocystaceae bacterium]
MAQWGWIAAALLVGVACGEAGGPASAGENSSSTRTGSSGDVSTTGTSSSSGAVVSSSESSSGNSTGETPGEPPDFLCPNPDVPECASNEGELRAAASVRSIVPDCFEAWVDIDANAVFDGDDTFLDCGCDRLCPQDDAYPGPDEGEGDGQFARVFVAGFQGNRLATGVRGVDEGLVGEGDGIDVRVLVLDQGQVRVVVLAVDTVGIFRPDVTRIRAAFDEAGAEVDAVIVHALHNHEGPDTMGLWGEGPLSSGYDSSAYGAQWRAAALEATLEAIDALEPVTAIRTGSIDSSLAQPAGASNLIRDSRDPWVVDPTVSVLSFEGQGPEPIVTLVNYGCHPETLGSLNTLLTADFVHAMRKTVEQGSQWRRAPGRAGVGGTAIVINGAVGGMMTTLGVEVTNPDGDTFSEPSFDKADSIGQLLGEAALDALDGASDLADPKLRVMGNTFELPVENTLYVLGFNAGVIERDELSKDTPQRIVTEMMLVELGPLRMLSIPGELLPELAIGGYDGSALHTDEAMLIGKNNPMPPNLDAAPQGPYLMERLASPEMPRPWLIGLGNDELGYIIPEYDFVLADSMPYFNQAEGDHYEETNSLGPQTAGILEAEADRLIDFANALADRPGLLR